MRISQIWLVIGLYCILPQAAFGQVEPPVAPARPAALFIPGPPTPPTTADQLRAQVNGLFLPAGFQREWSPIGPNGEVGGVITGPDKFKITFWITPTKGSQLAPGQVEFSSAAKRLKSEPHQWSREQYIADELVELTMASDNTLVVSYPHRGLNMSCHVNSMLQLSDALLVSLSITNNERRVSWDEAKKLILVAKVNSVVQLHSGLVFIRLADGTEYQTRQPQVDDVIKLIRALGKQDTISIITE